MMTTAPSPSPNSLPKACTNRVPRPRPTWARKSDTPKPSSHVRTAVRAVDGVNHTIVRWPGPRLAATTRRPRRRYSVAASRAPISCASRVFTRPATGALAKTARERSGIPPAGQPPRRDASEVQEDDSRVLEPRAEDTVAPVAAPRRDDGRGERAHLRAPPQRAQQRHVFEQGQLGEAPDPLEQRAPDEQPLVPVGQPVQRLAQALAQLEEASPSGWQVDREPEDRRLELRHVDDGGEQHAARGRRDAAVGVEKQQPLAASRPRSRVHLRRPPPAGRDPARSGRSRRRPCPVRRTAVRHHYVERHGDAAEVREQRGECFGLVDGGDDDADHGRTVSQPARRARAGVKLSATSNPPAINTRTKAPRVASRDPARIASAKNV